MTAHLRPHLRRCAAWNDDRRTEKEGHCRIPDHSCPGHAAGGVSAELRSGVLAGWLRRRPNEGNQNGLLAACTNCLLWARNYFGMVRGTFLRQSEYRQQPRGRAACAWEFRVQRGRVARQVSGAYQASRPESRRPACVKRTWGSMIVCLAFIRTDARGKLTACLPPIR